MNEHSTKMLLWLIAGRVSDGWFATACMVISLFHAIISLVAAWKELRDA